MITRQSADTCKHDWNCVASGMNSNDERWGRYRCRHCGSRKSTSDEGEAILNSSIGYVFDDGGRVDAGFKGKTGDCVTRALASHHGQAVPRVL